MPTLHVAAGLVAAGSNATLAKSKLGRTPRAHRVAAVRRHPWCLLDHLRRRVRRWRAALTPNPGGGGWRRPPNRRLSTSILSSVNYPELAAQGGRTHRNPVGWILCWDGPPFGL